MNAPVEVVPLWWEIGKAIGIAVGIFVITAWLERVRRILEQVRDGHRDLKREVSGSDGKNGLKSEVRELTKKVGELEDDFLVINSVLEMRGMYEVRGHHGKDRRDQTDEHPVRRLHGDRKEGT